MNGSWKVLYATYHFDLLEVSLLNPKARIALDYRENLVMQSGFFLFCVKQEWKLFEFHLKLISVLFRPFCVPLDIRRKSPSLFIKIIFQLGHFPFNCDKI